MTSGLASGAPAKTGERTETAGEATAAAIGARESAGTGPTEETRDRPQG